MGADGGSAVVPTANRGLKGVQSIGPDETEAEAIIDFLTFTVPLASTMPTLGACGASIRGEAHNDDESAQLAVAEWLVEETFQTGAITVEKERKGFRNFYDRHFRLTVEGESVGFVALGGARQKGTICLELTGGGCAHVMAWAHVAAMIETLSGKISRVDIAHDDFAGQHTLADAERWHAQGAFTTSGRPPVTQHMGWDDGSGKTLYIGKNNGNQQLCVYEKGRQQGARDDDAGVKWIRWEGRFGSKYRTIPMDVLTNPAAYLVGHYPPLQGWLKAHPMRMRTSAERAAANLASAVRFAKRQCGALFNLAKKHLPEPELFAAWVSAHLIRDRVPAWIKANPFGHLTVAAAFTT